MFEQAFKSIDEIPSKAAMRKLLFSYEALLLASLLVLNTAFVYAQSSGGEFQIVKSTIDNGGGTSVGGEFSLTGTIGQHDANHRISAGGGFALAGGFWANASVNDVIFNDGFESN